MISVDSLKKWGANTEEGLSRCFGNESLYLKLVGYIPKEASFEKLEKAIQINDLKMAFEAAHALKGVLGNLSLTPLYNPIIEITELLRSQTQMDYTSLLNQILNQKKELDKLFES